MPVRRLLTVALAASLVALVAGCGQAKIDHGKAEDLGRKIAGSGTVALKTISCPSDVKAKKGVDFDCDLVYADGTKGTITIHQLDDKGKIGTAGADIHIAGR
jgi:hypothetical protein